VREVFDLPAATSLFFFGAMPHRAGGIAASAHRAAKPREEGALLRAQPLPQSAGSRRGYSEQDVKKILGGNFLRVMRQVIGR
jgi:hypothetical protein